MPVLRGIKLTIISQWELRLHPEFPHPESSQFTSRCPDLNESVSISNLTEPCTSSESKADRVLGRPSTVSVYIPTQPGARFWLRYDVREAEVPKPPWYYFKLFMNGRHVASWGTNPETNPRGQIMRGLFDPSERWNYEVDGTIYKNNGTERRPFFFDKEVDGRSAANDGGLIEVRIFRAKGRQRRIPDPTKFRPQDHYGIIFPSGGLIDTPEDAKFYDWHLHDPKDQPFATFNFHYRSWDSLASLQLIPDDHPRALLMPSRSILSLNGIEMELKPAEKEAAKRAYRARLIRDEEIRNGAPDSLGIDERDMQGSISSDDSAIPRMSDPFDDNSESCAMDSEKTRAFQAPRPPSPYRRGLSPTNDSTYSFSDSGLPSMTQQEWQDIMDRPLPEIPVQHASLPYSRSHSAQSASSGAPSITPSLLSYLDRDSLSPPPIIGVATVVPVGRKILRREYGEGLPSSNEEYYPTDSADVPEPLTIPTKRQGVTFAPLGGSFSNITLRKRRNSPMKRLPKLETSPMMGSYEQDEVEPEHGLVNGSNDYTPLSLTESEWLRQAPSPNKENKKYLGTEQPWSLGEDKHTEGMERRSSLQKKAMDWYDNVTRNTAEQDDDDEVLGYNEGVKMPGNWI